MHEEYYYLITVLLLVAEKTVRWPCGALFCNLPTQKTRVSYEKFCYSRQQVDRIIYLVYLVFHKNLAVCTIKHQYTNTVCIRVCVCVRAE